MCLVLQFSTKLKKKKNHLGEEKHTRFVYSAGIFDVQKEKFP